ncbi:MAG: O-antigen ligase family protein [Clostridia bacterium]|nr:O-antigen ligase family protein [Clostridia bacterium]
MSRAFESLRRFYLGAYYPIFSALLILLGHATGAEVPFAAILLLSMVPAFFLCNDIRFAVLPLLCLIFTVSAKDYKPHDTGFDERYLNAPVLITAGIVLAIVFASLVIFAVRNAAQRNPFPKNGSLFGLLAFSLALLLNGLFSSNYILKNLLFGAIIALTLLGVYWLFASYLRFDSHSTDYLMYCLVIAALLIAAELILAYFTTVRFENGEIVKGSVVLGWGVWTTIGGMLAFLMPACFYFAASHRHGWIGFVLGLFVYFCILLSQSRGALLFGSLVLALCLLYLCIRGKNRKQNRIFTAILAFGAIAFCLLFSEKIFSLVGNFLSYGFGDNGRFDMWKIGFGHFCDHPIFGSGFYDSYTTSEWERTFDSYLYHNTAVQLFGSMGLVGVALYAYHRFCTVRLVLRHPTVGKTFFAICIFSLLICSLLDVLLFKIYPSLFYSMMLVFMDHDREACSTLP